MGVLRFKIVQLEPWQQDIYGPIGRVDNLMEIHQVKIGDTTNLQAIADVCARWTRTLSDRDHVTIWAIVPQFDELADVTAQDTVHLFLKDTPKITYAGPPVPHARVVRETRPVQAPQTPVHPGPPDISEIGTLELHPRRRHKHE